MKPKEKRLPIVLAADRFYMPDFMIKRFDNIGEWLWRDSKDGNEFVRTVKKVNPKVIISEYLKITDQIMAASNSLRGIVVWGVGYDHIDVEAASRRRIYIANTRGSNAESVAEHSFSLLLALIRKIVGLNQFVKEGKWSAKEESGIPNNLITHDLYGKTIGIIGFGAIGSRVARIAQGFNVRILTYDPHVDPQDPRLVGVELVSLQKLLRESDFVSIHAILSEETTGLISKQELDLMKPTAYLVNTSRGTVIDEEALVEALKQNRIAGAGLDTFTREPVQLDNPLLKLNNVIVSPHVAGGSAEALESTARTVCEEVISILQNKIPKNLVNTALVS